MISQSQRALEHFVNDEVQKISVSLYVWRKQHYEVLSYSSILKSKKTKADHFVKVWESGRLFGLRQISKELIKKHYPKLILDKE